MQKMLSSPWGVIQKFMKNVIMQRWQIFFASKYTHLFMTFSMNSLKYPPNIWPGTISTKNTVETVFPNRVSLAKPDNFMAND